MKTDSRMHVHQVPSDILNKIPIFLAKTYKIVDVTVPFYVESEV